MRVILLGLIVAIGLVVLLFGGSMPSSFNEIRSGDFQWQIKPLFDIGPVFNNINTNKYGKIKTIGQ